MGELWPKTADGFFYFPELGIYSFLNYGNRYYQGCAPNKINFAMAYDVEPCCGIDDETIRSYFWGPLDKEAFVKIIDPNAEKLKCDIYLESDLTKYKGDFLCFNGRFCSYEEGTDYLFTPILYRKIINFSKNNDGKYEGEIVLENYYASKIPGEYFIRVGYLDNNGNTQTEEYYNLSVKLCHNNDFYVKDKDDNGDYLCILGYNEFENIGDLQISTLESVEVYKIKKLPQEAYYIKCWNLPYENSDRIQTNLSWEIIEDFDLVKHPIVIFWDNTFINFAQRIDNSVSNEAKITFLDEENYTFVCDLHDGTVSYVPPLIPT